MAREPRAGGIRWSLTDAGAARMAARIAQERPEAQNTPGEACGGAESGLRSFSLWFPARLGPNRKRTRTVAGVKLTYRAREFELPPGPNGSRGNPIAHSRWVAEWRAAAKAIAKDAIRSGEPITRSTIHIVVHRRALGTADPDNDIARCKPLLDGMRDAGLLRRDTYDAVTFGLVQERRAGAAGVGMQIIVEEA